METFEITIAQDYAVCWLVNGHDVASVVGVIKNPTSILEIPRTRPVEVGLQGRDIGWTAWADAVVVEDRRFNTRT